MDQQWAFLEPFLQVSSTLAFERCTFCVPGPLSHGVAESIKTDISNSHLLNSGALNMRVLSPDFVALSINQIALLLMALHPCSIRPINQFSIFFRLSDNILIVKFLASCVLRPYNVYLSSHCCSNYTCWSGFSFNFTRTICLTSRSKTFTASSCAKSSCSTIE